MGVNLLHVALRTLANRWLIDTCTIQRQTFGTPTGDGTPASWTTIAAGVACSLQMASASGEVDDVGGGIAAVNRWLVRVPYGQDVTVLDRVVIGSRTFLVQAVEAKTFEVRRSISCVEIT